MSTIQCLLIGGPAHGRIVEVDEVRTEVVCSLGFPPTKNLRYVIDRFYVENKAGNALYAVGQLDPTAQQSREIKFLLRNVRPIATDF